MVPQNCEQLADRVRELERRLHAAQNANEARAVFLATMSHELREPLNGVLGMARLLCETPLDDEQRGYANAVVGSAGDLITLINDILDLSKIDAGKLELLKTNFALRPFLQRIAQHGTQRADQKAIQFTAVLSDDLPEILTGDPGRLRQILINLIGNAIKFTSEGDVKLIAKVQTITATSVKLSLEVRDTGIGIPDSLRESLFSAYAQANPKIPRLFGGSGLGLMISRRLVDAMGGNISVESKPGGGSCFRMLIEFDLPENGQIAMDRALLAGAALLIVDSQERTRKQTAALAAQWGIRVRAVATGQEAIHALIDATDRQDPFDLAIIDQTLSDMKGQDVVGKVRQGTNFCSSRFVLLAASGMRGDAAKAHTKGFDAYLPKPVLASTLMECLQMLRSSSDSDMITIHSMSEQRSQPLHVLIADDNPVNCKLATVMLERAGHSTEIVGNGAEAVDKIAIGGFDLVLMDVQMPVMDGLEATKAIRSIKDPEKSKVPILAVTANAMSGDDQRCLDVGMNGYLTKPIDRGKLLALVSEMGNRQAA